MKIISHGALLLAITVGSSQFAWGGSASSTTVASGASSLDATVEVDQDQATPDIAAGEAHYKKNCRACHGPTGKGLSSYPKLAGKPAEYLVGKLEQYRAGEKLGPNTMLMAPRAKKLSDDDIANIVHFIVTSFD